MSRSFEEMVEFAEYNDLKVLSSKSDYKTMESKIKFECKCGNKFEKTYTHLRLSPICHKCSKKISSGKLKHPYEKIYGLFKESNCELLTTKEEYNNTSTKVKYICSCGNESEITVSSFINGRRCEKCGRIKSGNSNTINFNEIKDYINNDSGNYCKLLSEEKEYKNTKTLLKIKCKCGNEFETSFANFKHENKRQCNKCSLEQNSGENSNLWKGGTSSERDRIKNTEEYKQWRESVFKRDNYTCQCCKDNKGNNLEAHHIENFSSNEDLRFNINNGITLCKKCHNPNQMGSYHNIYGTHNNTKEQLDKYINSVS